jgi:hypothetical protein
MKRLALILLLLPSLACDQQTEPTPLDPKANCQVGVGGFTVCIDGHGNVITINNPPPTPSPSPDGVARCSKGIQLYEENVGQAARTVPIAQSLESYKSALLANLRLAGFKGSSGGLLSSDEIAVKINDAFSETYDIQRADGLFQVLYVETCSPARF